MYEEKIIHTALENLAKNGIQGTLVSGVKNELDLLIGHQHYRQFIEVKKEIRNHQIPQIQQMAGKHKNKFLLIAEKIYPKVREELRNNQISYLEANGNLWMKKGHLFVWIDTNKPLEVEKEKTNRAFTRTGLKVIFHLLLDDENVNQTYRDLANRTHVGLGNINYVMNGLKEEGYLIKLSKTKYKLVKKKELLEKWMIAYQERLKPALFIGRFKFLNEKASVEWKQLQFKTENTIWGGEPAGDILTNYLKPGEFTVYTEETRAELMKNYHLVPDTNGNIQVYKKFWEANDGTTTAPPILAYADLMNTGVQRNMETAQKIYDNALQDRF